jgi:HD-GYP domain-containing protein (c-di-GMP phosphodiesterase class II)
MNHKLIIILLLQPVLRVNLLNLQNLTSERPYKKAFFYERAKAIIIEGRGTHFDPEIVDIFVDIELEFKNLKIIMVDS